MLGSLQPVAALLLGMLFIQPQSAQSAQSAPQSPKSCDSVKEGYTCQTDISRLWGQYSPYYEVESEIPPGVPPQCTITFAQILSRHGARFPNPKKTKRYGKTIEQIQKNVRSFKGKYAFLQKYKYDLGADDLTPFGVQEMVNSGTDFFNRYEDLVKKLDKGPFVRASDQQRVVDSATNFTAGFHTAKVAAAVTDKAYPYDTVLISEQPAYGSCPAFESSIKGKDARAAFAKTFVPKITSRLNSDLKGASLDTRQTISLMDLCPYDTVNSPTGEVSPFCTLFTQDEWASYDYYQSLNKYYSYGAGNPLGPSQGVGFVNELIARLTEEPVQDHTSVNHTLDNGSETATTFPLDRKLYADFTHEDGITSVMFALGLWNSTRPLSTSKLMTAEDLAGYTVSRTVPFAARMIVEKMECQGEPEELVRVLVNGRVISLETCPGVDELGRCKVGDFVKSLTFAEEGGVWEQCYATVAGKITNGVGDIDLSDTS